MRPLIRELVDTVVAVVGRDASGLTILDVATGPGEPAFSLAKALPGSLVTATDFAPGMVAEAETRAKEQGLEGKLRFAVADGEDLCDFATGSMDVVTCNCAVFMMPHHDRALAEFHRVLKPGGLLVATAWSTVPEQTDIIRVMMGTCLAMDPDAGKAMQAIKKFATNAQFVEVFRTAGFQNVQSRDVNCPAHIPAASIQGAFIDNAMLQQLWERLEAGGRPTVRQEAEEALVRIAAEQGFLQPDGSLTMPTNVAVMVTGRAAGSR
ncbi:hypothetical protein WJX72_000580 [[Myrmecia] bisecta]|uniref:Methyltransferase type 11 domain-containing protein n=1 Tax=[Myrmecia] bisecta TaxID=41462 RepID=A0AAW1PRK8_9CHLO